MASRVRPGPVKSALLTGSIWLMSTCGLVLSRDREPLSSRQIRVWLPLTSGPVLSAKQPSILMGGPASLQPGMFGASLSPWSLHLKDVALPLLESADN